MFQVLNLQFEIKKINQHNYVIENISRLANIKTTCTTHVCQSYNQVYFPTDRSKPSNGIIDTIYLHVHYVINDA